jgi:hypothetical protein
MVYPYSSVGACYVRSESHVVTSKMWFTTPALDDNTIKKLSKLQLFTKSKDQGYASVGSTTSYSWFELVILNSPDDKVPRMEDNAELAWPSHENKLRVKEYRILEGQSFGASHSLRQQLLPGNAIGVRVVTRFRDWRNYAAEGRLELHFSEPRKFEFSCLEYSNLSVVDQKKPTQSKKIEQIANTNEQMMQIFKKLYSLDARPELDRVIYDRMQEPLKWGDYYGVQLPQLRVLSFGKCHVLP